jgi:predicted 3-demethylubiquinone-9 3-methyltransferase (glyoxalase superfamily)
MRSFAQDVNYWIDYKLDYSDHCFLFLNQKGCDLGDLYGHLMNAVGSFTSKSIWEEERLDKIKVQIIPFEKALNAIFLARKRMADDKIKFIAFMNTVNAQIDGKLEEEDYLFLYTHQKSCNAEELTRHLVKIGSTNAKSSLRSGWLNGTKVGVVWQIPFNEVVRAISLARNWTPIKQVGLTRRINPGLFHLFAKDKYELVPNLSGAISIRNRDIKTAVKEYKESIKGSRKGARSFSRFAKEKELSTETFGDIFKVSSVTVVNWHYRGHIHAVKRKSCFFIKHKEIRSFAKKAVSGKVGTKPAVIEICRQILSPKPRKRNQQQDAMTT